MPNKRQQNEVRSWHVATAAEAYAAYILARMGYYPSVQYGANQPGYDILVEKDDRTAKISVKGSRDGSWGLTHGFLKNADYNRAIDDWLERHKGRYIFFLVQFINVDLLGTPRCYIATPLDIACHMRTLRNGHGDTILHERKTWNRGVGAGAIGNIPIEWSCSEERLEQLMNLT